MKRLILSLALVFAFGTTLSSCRDTKKEEVEITIDDDGDVEDALEEAAEDVGDAVNEGVDEIKENTGTGGTDDN